MHLKIVTVDRTIVDTDVRSLITRSQVGEFQIMPGHTPLISLTVPTDTAYITMDGTEHRLFTSTGLLKVLHDKLLFIADAAEKPEEIELARARTALAKAQGQLKEASPADRPYLKEAIARAKMRIRVKEGGGAGQA